MIGKARCVLAATVLALGCGAEPEIPELRMAYPHQLVTMDPQAHSDTVTGTVLAAVYESLVVLEPGLPIRPALADRWITPDHHSWQLHVREGVVFHDGSPLTPADVVASINRARASASSGHQLEEISEVRELPGQDRIIEITTEAPTPLLLTRLESVPVVPADFDPRAPVGTGPYRWEVGSIDGPIVLRRWEAYWGRPAAYPEVFIQFVPFQEDVAKMLHQGKLDVVASVSFTYVRDHTAMEGWRVIASPAVATTYLGLNTTLPQLEDPRVREAICLAIDRRGLVASVFPEGAAEPAFSLVPPEVFGYRPGDRAAPADAKAARSLLSAAGSASREPLRLAYSERNALAAAFVSNELNEVGFEVEDEMLPYDVFYRGIEAGTHSLFLFNWTFRVADASTFLDAFVRTRDPIRGLGTLNGANISDAGIDALIESAMIEPQANLRLEKLQSAVSRVSGQFAYLPLFKPSNLALVRDGVRASRQGMPMLRPQDLQPAE